MSRLYGVVQGASRTAATRRAHRVLTTTAATWHGAIEVSITVAEDGTERFEVVQRTWHGAGINQVLASGIVGMKCLAPIQQAAEADAIAAE